MLIGQAIKWWGESLNLKLNSINFSGLLFDEGVAVLFTRYIKVLPTSESGIFLSDSVLLKYAYFKKKNYFRVDHRIF